MGTNPLGLFCKETRQWFETGIGAPTAVQEAAWPAIKAGRHTLVSAPTGTGKTLSAFLVFLDGLLTQVANGTLMQELQLIYVSPLKSLAGDIRENLKRPLDGIFRQMQENGLNVSELPPVQVAVRTGDTTQKDRRAMIKTPPHILITTPESLYLMLTSESGKQMLKTAKAVVIDELHALIDSKRGAHLMLSVARLDELCPQPLQRIGLSATIEPLDLAARYLSPDEVTVAAPPMEKKAELIVTSPLEDMRALENRTIWPDLAAMVYEHCKGTKTAIAFVEGRLFAEKLAYYVNQIAGEGFARTHHGSLSKERRFEVENALRGGTLRLLCATSSMELGIDVGEIDRVLQIGCPRSISSTLQRLGRAGHNPGRVSVMHIFPRTAAEGLYCGLTAQVARQGGVEQAHPPRVCLDVLSQHLVSMAAGSRYTLDEALAILKRAYPFQGITKEELESVLQMLAGDYEHERDIPVRPRLLYDRIHETVEGDRYSRMLAVSAGGTIPDRGYYPVKTENNVKLGELEEEFVFEARVGDKFLLGSFAWRIKSIQKDAVIVSQTNADGAQPPFWRGDWSGQGMKTWMAFGKIFRNLTEAYAQGELLPALLELGLDEAAAQNAARFLDYQFEASGILPDDRTVLIEHFCDETGARQMMVHSMFGRRVNAPLAVLAQETVRTRTDMDVACFDDDYGFLLMVKGEQKLPEQLLKAIPPQSARPVLEALLVKTALFNMAFRYNAARALMMGVKNASRQPLWVQRIRSTELLGSIVSYPDHPLIAETRRECLEDYWDLEGVETVLKGIQGGTIQIREVYLDAPSPMSLPLRRQVEATMMYEYTPTTEKIQKTADEALDQLEMIRPAPEQLERAESRSRLPEDEKQLHSLLMMEGDLIAGELDVPLKWLESLSRQGRAGYIEPGLWVAAEHLDEYARAFDEQDREARSHILRRALRYRGAMTAGEAGERYCLPDRKAQELLDGLVNQKAAVKDGEVYYHAELYSRARRETIKHRRRQIETLPPERYAALMAGRLRIAAPPEQQLEDALAALKGTAYPAAAWEQYLLPARVNGYQPRLLDSVLSKGGLFYGMEESRSLTFYPYSEIDWGAEPPEAAGTLEGNEKIVYEALLQRGACFSQALAPLIGGASPFDLLLSLMKKGLVHADSFVPVRQILNQEKLKKQTAKRRADVRARTLAAGRWEAARPVVVKSAEAALNEAFDRAVILCRETVQGIAWSEALEILRVWEYTGRVRRGYFIEGMSGAQFVRSDEFARVQLALAEPRDETVWISAADPAQVWGKSIKHRQGRSFMNLAGNMVALRKGVPVAVFERKGQVLRVFDEDVLGDALRLFAQDYVKQRIYPQQDRIVVKEYPPEAAQYLAEAGFSRQMNDFALYHGYI